MEVLQKRLAIKFEDRKPNTPAPKPGPKPAPTPQRRDPQPLQSPGKGIPRVPPTKK